MSILNSGQGANLLQAISQIAANLPNPTPGQGGVPSQASSQIATDLPLRFRKRKADAIEDVDEEKKSRANTKFIHPTEISGPSNDPQLQLMGLPREIKEQIFGYFLTYDKEICLDFSVLARPLLSANSALVSKNGRNTPAQPLYHRRAVVSHDRAGVQRAISPAILRTCKQAYEDGWPVLYERNKFFTKHARMFAKIFEKPLTTGIPVSKACFIRDLVLWPNGFAYNGGELEFHQVMNLIRFKMPALQRLQLTWTVDIRIKGSSYDEAGVFSDEFMREVGWLTCQHPQLRKAIWNGQSAITRAHLGERVEVPLTVHFVRAGSEGKDFDFVQSGIMGGPFDKKIDWIPGENIILDCLKLRTAEWHQLSIDQLPAFALPDTATSSEPLSVDVN